MEEKRVIYRIEGPVFIITLNDPRHLNSLTFDDFVEIALLLEKADNDPKIFITALQSTADFFSSGGKFSTVLDSRPANDNEINGASKVSQMIGVISSPNVFVADTFRKHRKLLVCCLNGPAVGLSACLVMLCDIVYCKNDSVYLLFPFTNLGFSAEVGSSVTLAKKIGINKTNEHLIFSKPLTYEDLKGKVLNYNYVMKDTDEFNKKVVLDLQKKLKGTNISLNNLKAMKTQIRDNSGYGTSLLQSQALETMATFPFWMEGEPFKRFQQMQKKERKHKL
ncbi:putative dodecenoyl-CoA isomerase DCI1 NDAI_0D02720 [Naumovozyma dairenensis CBS 421]|uniref:Uncharacterized protein n=1 Tax=Naumovozyma dairenensis (strain ATCC 10597 / BCRC 20456 / CBS 421 / NBRC 0211 / NRRL Y-12639) TaxID=1071378 RepID=G0W9X5_NAUDC|nr:hypothetical protein NDAI_0D02720 [Naumovozyma dairenensis CBS 421]CCD24586.1 hypothetical protein NDAI_0D02720 [Naumovozyma dairenensis CBS 421]